MEFAENKDEIIWLQINNVIFIQNQISDILTKILLLLIRAKGCYDLLNALYKQAKID